VDRIQQLAAQQHRRNMERLNLFHDEELKMKFRKQQQKLQQRRDVEGVMEINGLCGGEYEVILEIANGAFGRVFGARHIKTGETVSCHSVFQSHEFLCRVDIINFMAATFCIVFGMSLKFHQVAIKVIDKSGVIENHEEMNLKREVALLDLLDHPNVIKSKDVKETDRHLILFLEYAAGGTLLDYINVNGRLSEIVAAHLFQKIISAVNYLHVHKVTHRDIKAEVSMKCSFFSWCLLKKKV
jgi:serine/threonine protein kinase